MTQPNEMILVGVAGEPSRMFSTTSGNSMYEIDSSFRKMTLIKPSSRVNIREIFALRSHYSITMEVWRKAKSIGGLAELKENMLSVAGRSTSAMNKIAVKYNKSNLEELLKSCNDLQSDLIVPTMDQADKSGRLFEMLSFGADGLVGVCVRNFRLQYYWNQIHFERPGGHRFRRYANCEKWTELFGSELNPGTVDHLTLMKYSEEDWTKIKQFMVEHGSRLRTDEFQFIGDESVVRSRRRAYVFERMSGTNRGVVLDNIFNTIEDEAVHEVAAELMRRLPMNDEGIDSAINESGSINFDMIFDVIDKTDVLIEIKKICCGNEDVYSSTCNTLREEYRIAS